MGSVLSNIYLAVPGLSCSTWDLSLEHVNSLVVAHGLHNFGVQAELLCGMWDLSSQTRVRTRVPSTARWFLNNCTTKKVPQKVFDKIQRPFLIKKKKELSISGIKRNLLNL